MKCQTQQVPEPLSTKTKKASLTESEKDAPSSGLTKKKTNIQVGDTEYNQIRTVNGKPHDKFSSEMTPKGTSRVPEQKEAHVESVETQNIKPPEKQSGLFGFSFGGLKSRPPSPQLAASAVSGGVLGFGSSFLSSASNLISSAVHDESPITPQTSRKSSIISLKNTPPVSCKSSAAHQHGENKETEKAMQDQLAKESVPLLKKDTACPLCKVDLKDNPPNYNTCTQCKNIVCNLCGFSPIPQETEVRYSV